MASPQSTPLIATCAGGLEPVLTQEITERGWQVVASEAGAVRFTGPESAVAEANIVLRTASRILVPVTKGAVHDYEDLYRLTSRADWMRLAPPARTLGVTAVSTDKLLGDTRFAALKVKDAIVDLQRRKTGKRSEVDRRSPDVGIVVFISNGTAEISLDSTGSPLHMRGYRTEAGSAPLRETVAAGMVLLSGWDRRTPLLDPFCGSGTILIEAAMIASGIHPGSGRDDFGFLSWPGADRAAFERTRKMLSASTAEATIGKSASEDRSATAPVIFGADRDASVVDLARRNAGRAGVRDLITFESREFFGEPVTPAGAMLLCNPPYGERMELDDAAGFYRQMGDHLKQHYKGSIAWILSANRAAMKQLGLRSSAKLPLFNGGLDSRLYRIALF